MKKLKVMTVLSITALLLMGCTEEKQGNRFEPQEEKKGELKKIEGIDEVHWDDKTLAKASWKELNGAERTVVNGKPEVVKKHPGDSKELELARSLAKKSKKALRVVYFKTVDEKYNGKFLLYAVGNEFVAKSPRKLVEIATEEEMDKWVKESKTLEELQQKLLENHKWSETAFDTAEWHLKEDKNPSPDKRFFQIAQGYYGVPHQREVITDIKPNDEKIYSQVMIDDQYGDVTEKPFD